MKAVLICLLALGLVGCTPKPAPAPARLTVGSGEMTVEQLAAWSSGRAGGEVFAAFVTAIGPATNRDEILTRYAVEMDRRIVEYLSTQSRGALLGKLDSLSRQSNRHEYTREQLEAALELKEARAKEREASKVLR